MYYNRKQRRELAKSMGLLGKKETPQQWHDRVSRSIEAGRQIHQQFMNEVETRLRNAAADREAKILNSLTEKWGEEKAKEIVASNRAIAEAREEKLRKRRIKQRKAYQEKLAKNK